MNKRPIKPLLRRRQVHASLPTEVQTEAQAEARSDIRPAGSGNASSDAGTSRQPPADPLPLYRDVSANEAVLRAVFHNCTDVVFRTVWVDDVHRLLLVYIDGVVDQKRLEDEILRPLIYEFVPAYPLMTSLHHAIRAQLLPIAQTSTVSSIHEVVDNIVKCNSVILSDGEDVALVLGNKSWTGRGVEEPAAETVVRGPREGFTETLRVNTSLIRRRIRNPKLKMEALVLGTVTYTDVVIAYIEGVAREDILNELRTRLGRIEIDSVLESGYVEGMIQDNPFSPFPQIQNTERPDVVAAALLDGRIAILVDGTPFVLLLPMTFWMSLEASEDYYERFLYANAIRVVRMIFLLMSLFFPSLYVAVTTFHPQMLPTQLLLTFASAREPSPLPAVVEALIMEFTFEGLREAGVRLPRAVGSAISIVGALVIGQAAVQAGIVSAPIVIVVASTGIASFAIPRYSFSIPFRMLRFPLLILAGTLGFYGIAVGLIAIMIHVVSLRSFGVPYFSPIAPFNARSAKNLVVRPPIWTMHRRSDKLTGGKSKRMPKGQGPRKPRERVE